jgi:hypothetical protein
MIWLTSEIESCRAVQLDWWWAKIGENNCKCSHFLISNLLQNDAKSFKHLIDMPLSKYIELYQFVLRKKWHISAFYIFRFSFFFNFLITNWHERRLKFWHIRSSSKLENDSFQFRWWKTIKKYTSRWFETRKIQFFFSNIFGQLALLHHTHTIRSICWSLICKKWDEHQKKAKAKKHIVAS